MYDKDYALVDDEINNSFHESIIRNKFDEFLDILKYTDFEIKYLNYRNFEGKSPITLVLEHGRLEMFELLI